MTISLHHGRDKHQLIISGEFDGDLAEEARRLFSQLLEDVRYNVSIDLSDVSFIGTSGIGAIAFLYKRLRSAGKELALENLQEQPLELIQQLRIDTVIKII